jgi:MYXO-CTERM domain-containing protein
MGSLRVPFLLLSLTVTASLAAACLAPEDDEAEEQGDAVTGGKSEDDTPLVYLTSRAEPFRVTCVGTMLNDRMAVTSAACANRDFLVKRAAKDKKTVSAIRQVHVPPTPAGGAAVEIAVVELETPIKGEKSRIAGMDLSKDYKVVGANTFGGALSDASIVKGTMQGVTATHGLIVPDRGKQICDSDVGAAVFRKAPGKFLFFDTGHWELSGLIVGRDGVSFTSSLPISATDAGTYDGGEYDGGAGTDAAVPTTDSPTTPVQQACSGGAWKVAPLAIHATFLKQLAPEAFPEPKPSGSGGGFPGFPGFPLPFPGGGGGMGNANLRSCTLVTTSLPPTRTSTRSQTIQARASFVNVPNGQAMGQFGIAPRNNPTAMTWTPAVAIDPTTTQNFDARFEGGVDAPSTEGEYLVAFRASGNGGQSWTECDTDGSDNGYSPTRAILMQVTLNAATTTNPYTPPDYTRNDSDDNDFNTPPTPVTPPKKKKSSDSGCAVTTTPTASSGLPVVAALLGLAAIFRRRRSS